MRSLDPPLLHRLSAFTTDPSGGNPAGVHIGASLPDDADMQRIAREVGDSETVFLAATPDRLRWTARYFSPEAEVSFCGHATVAAGVMLGELMGEGSYVLETTIGGVPVEVRRRDAHLEAALTSVTPKHRPAPARLVGEALAALAWEASELNARVPPAVAYAGAWHLVLAAGSPGRLARLAYDFDALKRLMLREGLTTIQLVWWEGPRVLHARNPFPVGGVVEDPATGAAAAALGGYLRDAGLVEAPTMLHIRQGAHMGRPSLLRVDIPREGGIVVSGPAVPLPAPVTPRSSASQEG